MRPRLHVVLFTFTMLVALAWVTFAQQPPGPPAQGKQGDGDLRQ